MYILLLGLLIFFGIHLVPSFPRLRSRLVSNMGEGRYKGLYSIISLAGIVLIIYGMSEADFQAIWNPPVWSRHVVMPVMLIAFYLFAAADMKSNIKRFIRHPMLLGVMLWSGVHLLANGDLASIILFGSFFVFSVIGMISANIRGAARQETRYPLKKDVVSLAAGLAGYGIFIFIIHPYLIGVRII